VPDWQEESRWGQLRVDTSGVPRLPGTARIEVGLESVSFEPGPDRRPIGPLTTGPPAADLGLREVADAFLTASPGQELAASGGRMSVATGTYRYGPRLALVVPS
jgi:hypothetical protein